MNKKRVLFVDDDPDILAGMGRMLRSQRDRYETCFAASGQEALAIMAENPCQIVISDMRMPVMDGADLLGTIKKRYPQAIRIMLTGQADETMVLRTVGVVHQFLAKPCESENVKTMLARVSRLYDQLNDTTLKSIISSVDSLPSLPETYRRLQELLLSPHYSISDIAAIIEQDVAMSAKILQLVNSAFFGLFRHIDSPAHAVSLLGLDTVKALVLGVQIFHSLPGESKRLPVKDLFTHSIAVASIARRIASSLGGSKEDIDEAFIAGMLHDIGKLLLLSKMPQVYEKVLVAIEEGLPQQQAELSLLGADHGAIGAYLAGLWGLPGSIVEALCFHHSLDESSPAGFHTALAVYLADTLYHRQQAGRAGRILPDFSSLVVARYDLGDQLDRLTALAGEVLGD